MIVRHGTRYPSSKVIRKMKDRLPVLRDFVIQNHKLKRGNKTLMNKYTSMLLVIYPIF
jgi:hypothetical protein